MERRKTYLLTFLWWPPLLWCTGMWHGESFYIFPCRGEGFCIRMRVLEKQNLDWKIHKSFWKHFSWGGATFKHTHLHFSKAAASQSKEDYMSVVVYHSPGHKISWLYSMMVQFCLHFHTQQTAKLLRLSKSGSQTSEQALCRHLSIVEILNRRGEQALSAKLWVPGTQEGALLLCMHSCSTAKVLTPCRGHSSFHSYWNSELCIKIPLFIWDVVSFHPRHSYGLLPAAEGNSGVLSWGRLEFPHHITHQIQIQSKVPREIRWMAFAASTLKCSGSSTDQLACSFHTGCFLTVTPWVWILFTM